MSAHSGIFSTLLYLNCEAEGCHHRRQMDLPLLVAILGRNYPLRWLVDRAVCSKCGQKQVSVTAPPDLGEKGTFSYPEFTH
jgi:hypothetical protein